MGSKFNFIVLLVLIFYCFTKVHSETVYVTVTVNKTEEETTSVAVSTPTIQGPEAKEEEERKKAEYKKFEEAFLQTNDECMEHAYAVALNLFTATQLNNVNCENRYSGTLEELNKINPCNQKSAEFNNGIKYMNSVVNLLCTSYVDTNSTNLEDKLGGEIKKTILCPQIQYLLTNDTRFKTELLKGCNGKDANDTCLVGIYRRYKEIKEIRKKLDYKDQVYLTNGNETVKINMNIPSDIYEDLEECDTYVNTKSNAISIIASLTTILLYSLFVVFINI